MKIVRFTAENLKKLTVVEITPKGSMVQITGPNGSGKSSVLDAIFYALAGTKEIPAQPIRRGQLSAIVKLDLGEIKVTRRFTETGSTLVVEGEKGARFPSPQKMLDDLLGTLTFDPLEFSRMDAKKQLETLRHMVPLEVDIDKLDFLNADEFKLRTEVNREAARIAAQISGIVVPPDTPDEPISIEALMDEMAEAGDRNATVARLQSEALSARNFASSFRSRAKDVKKRIEELKDEISDLESRVLQFEGLAKENDTKAASPLPGVVDTSVIREKIDAAKAINQKVLARTQRGALEKQLREVESRAHNLTKAMQERTEAKQKAIQSAKMPVAGLSFGDGGILFNDLPFNQASDAEQLRVSVAIAMAANPKLRVLRIRDGSLLDEKSLALVAGMADEQDFQIWLEKVDTSGKVGIVMEDGHIKQGQ